MVSIRRFWRLPVADRALLIETGLWLGGTRVGLWVLPLGLVRRLLVWAAARSSQQGHRLQPSAERIAWAMSVAQRVVPRATCLPQALATEALLKSGGHPADLRIGVHKTDAGRLTAHAWVESEGRVVVGDIRELSNYAPLPPLPTARAWRSYEVER